MQKHEIDTHVYLKAPFHIRAWPWNIMPPKVYHHQSGRSQRLWTVGADHPYPLCSICGSHWRGAFRDKPMDISVSTAPEQVKPGPSAPRVRGTKPVPSRWLISVRNTMYLFVPDWAIARLISNLRLFSDWSLTPGTKTPQRLAYLVRHTRSAVEIRRRGTFNHKGRRI